MAEDFISVDELLYEARQKGVEKTVKIHRKTPLSSRLLEQVFERLENEPVAGEFLAAYPLAPSHLLEKLAHERVSPGALTALAGNPRTPPHLLNELATHDDPKVRASAAAAEQISPRAMIELTKDADEGVRLALAKNKSIRSTTQALLAQDAAPAVRAQLVGNPSLAPEIALALSTDESALVRCTVVATWREEEEELVPFWAETDREELQLALLERDDLSADVIKTLLHSAHPSVRKAAASRTTPSVDEVVAWAHRGDEEERVNVAALVNLPRPLQRAMAEDASPKVRSALAENSALDRDILAYLVGTAADQIGPALAASPNLDAELAEELLARGGDPVARAFAYQKNIDADLLEKLLLNRSFVEHLAFQGRQVYHFDPQLARELAKHELPRVRAFAVRGGEWSAEELQAFAADPASAVREAAEKTP